MMLGLPTGIRVCLFDLDGVLTDTAAVHAAAWKEMFDEFLRAYSAQQGIPFAPFDARAEYDAFVDGKPRVDGVRDFLASRGITLPEGTPNDPPSTTTVNGLGNRKNAAVQHRIRTEGVHVFEGSRRYLQAAEQAGLRRAVVSSSANTREVLDVTGPGPPEAQPGVLDGVVGLGQRAEHPVGHRPQVGPVLLESVGQPLALVHRHIFALPVVIAMTPDPRAM